MFILVHINIPYFYNEEKSKKNSFDILEVILVNSDEVNFVALP